MGFKTSAEQMAKQARRALAATGLGALVALGAALAPAQAAVVVGAFDPAFGPSLPNLGYRGTATFFVPDACFGFTGIITNGNACSLGAMTVQAVNLQLYNVNTPGQPTLFTNITAIPSFVFDVLIAFDASTNQNELKGVQTTFSSAFNVTLNDGLGVNLNNVPFFFGFASPASAASAAGAQLRACTNNFIGNSGCNANTAQPGNTPVTVFGKRESGPSNVPEPSGIALSLLALGAAAVATRRRFKS
jgi:PEP-CTERM motif